MEQHSRSRAGASGTRSSRTAGGPEELASTKNDMPRQQQAPGLVGRMKDGATTQLTTQKDRATDGIGTLAQAVRHTTERLRNEQHDTIAQYVERAAEQLERLSDRLRQKDVNELLQDTQRFARRQPALFIGGSFAAGLLIARFLKSSREDEYGTVSSRIPLDTPASELPGAY
jgi:hypothetical protein